jgi:hypothetical protein
MVYESTSFTLTEKFIEIVRSDIMSGFELQQVLRHGLQVGGRTGERKEERRRDNPMHMLYNVLPLNSTF